MNASPQLLLDPVGAVAAVVHSVEPSLSQATVQAIVEDVGGGRAKRRRLAASLSADSSVLVTGCSPAPRVVGDLLLALRAAGATHVSLPHCAGCRREITSMQRRGEDWYCSQCFVRPEVCAACGEQRQVAFRDRHGRPRCGSCRDQDPGDPAVALAELITRVDPGLSPEVAMRTITTIVTKPAHFQKLLWALQDAPELLTGEGAKAPFPMILRLIDALCDAGATVIRRPACAHCGRVVTLSKKADRLRICRNCCARAHAVACSRCGDVREPAARDAKGRPLCPFCLINDPINHEDCVSCGRRRRVALRDSVGPLCGACVPKTIAMCAMCGDSRPCRISSVTGQPCCTACTRSWAVCSCCATLAPVRAGTREAPLCASCSRADAAVWKTCPSCGETGSLLARICIRCRLRKRLDELLANADGQIRPELDTLYRALASIDRPTTALNWLSRSAAVSVLGELASGARALSHAALDELPPTKTLVHLRAVLVATGALEERDEHLAQLEVWAAQAVAARSDVDERQLLHRYAVWHVLRRLRQRTQHTRVTANQAKCARENIQAAVALLDWLTVSRLTLSTCTQLELDSWMVGASTAQRGRTGPFVRWAKKQRLTRLDFPATAWTGPTGALDTEGRWQHARRLIHDDTLAPEHRLAGLILLFYAQTPAAISRLTLDDIESTDDEVRIRFGREPVLVPEPLAGLTRQLVVTRQGHARVGNVSSSPWLFPGGRPGQPISSYRLTERLHQIGLQPGQARSTALFELAGELPAAILARLLGIHISVAVKWQRVAGGDWTNYAAEVSRWGNDHSPLAAPLPKA